MVEGKMVKWKKNCRITLFQGLVCEPCVHWVCGPIAIKIDAYFHIKPYECYQILQASTFKTIETSQKQKGLELDEPVLSQIDCQGSVPLREKSNRMHS